ncbi:hypothetical protein NGRA_2149, partial [Nosema granulosis]
MQFLYAISLRPQKMLSVLVFVGLILSQISYKLKRIYQEVGDFEYIGQRVLQDEVYKFYLGRDKEVADSLELPEMTNRLMRKSVMTLSKKDKIYEIDPFKYVKMSSAEGESTLGYFSELKFVDKNLVCIYKNGDVCEYDNKKRLSAKVVFTKGDITDVEKYFSGEPSEYVLKVSGDFLCNKRQTATVYYLKIGKDGLVKPKETANEKRKKEDEDLSWIKFSPEMMESLKLSSTNKEGVTGAEEGVTGAEEGV